CEDFPQPNFGLESAACRNGAYRQEANFAAYARIGTWEKASPSSACRIAPTRPSIISEGATMSAPARAWLRAIFCRQASVSSFTTWPSFTMPQWPCVVYSSTQTSVITIKSVTVSFIERTARGTMQYVAHASLKSSSLRVD